MENVCQLSNLKCPPGSHGGRLAWGNSLPASLRQSRAGVTKPLARARRENIRSYTENLILSVVRKESLWPISRTSDDRGHG